MDFLGASMTAGMWTEYRSDPTYRPREAVYSSDEEWSESETESEEMILPSARPSLSSLSLASPAADRAEGRRNLMLRMKDRTSWRGDLSVVRKQVYSLKAQCAVTVRKIPETEGEEMIPSGAEPSLSSLSLASPADDHADDRAEGRRNLMLRMKDRTSWRGDLSVTGWPGDVRRRAFSLKAQCAGWHSSRSLASTEGGATIRRIPEAEGEEPIASGAETESVSEREGEETVPPGAKPSLSLASPADDRADDDAGGLRRKLMLRMKGRSSWRGDLALSPVDDRADADEGKDRRNLMVRMKKQLSWRGDAPRRSALVTSRRSSCREVTREVRVTNWAETVEADGHRFRYPRDVGEVVALVRSNDKVRCSGALHSCAPLISSQGIILSLTKLDQIISIDRETRIVRMQAGVRMHDLCDCLADYGLAVGTLGTIDWQTICGAVMTGTHGGALTVPSLHDFARSYTMVLPDGTLRRVDKESSPAMFRAMAPSMGLFGAVVEMEMEVVPLQILEARIVSVPMDDVIGSFDHIMKTNKYARIVVYPSIKKATIWTANPVASREAAVANGAVNHEGYINFRNEEEKALLEEHLALCDAGEFEPADRALERVLESQVGRLGHYVGRYNHVLCLERNNGIPHADIEMNFDYDKHKEVLRTAFDYCDRNRIPYYNFEVRTTARDDALLSCCRSRPGMWIDFQAKASVSKRFFGDMASLLRPFGFRKHWAKGTDHSDPRQVAEQFPDIGRFIEAVREVDPKGKFQNEQGQLWLEALELLSGDCMACPAEGGSLFALGDRAVPVKKRELMYARTSSATTVMAEL